MSTPFRLLLPRDVYQAVLDQALAERPNECCGWLAGRIEPANEAGAQPAIGRVVERFPFTNTLASPRRYLADSVELLRAERALRERGLELLAIYHSHPIAEPIPSRTDLEWNFYPGVMHLIVSLVGPEPVLRAWWLLERDFREAEWGCGD